MLLHENKELFTQLVTSVAVEYNLPETIVEKDYFVTLFLRKITENHPNIIFKGGTSLSKCYHIIDRFSEDIDLNIMCDTKLTEGERKKLKEHITDIIDELGFSLSNPYDIRSKRDFNRYIIDYSANYVSDYLNNHLVVETAVFIRSYPFNKMKASCYISDWLKTHNHIEIIYEYNMANFELNVQSIERTFIDKVFAICDYYLDNTPKNHSRHLYDLSKILPEIKFDEALQKLINEVKADRRQHKTCLSAQEGISINNTLSDIIEKDFYKEDYESITIPLLFNTVDYEIVKKAIKEIVKANVFDRDNVSYYSKLEKMESKSNDEVNLSKQDISGKEFDIKEKSTMLENSKPPKEKSILAKLEDNKLKIKQKDTHKGSPIREEHEI